MKVTISAQGHLKKFLPEQREVELSGEAQNVKNLFVSSAGISPTESGVCYLVNGRIQKADYQPKSGDTIVVVKLGGAG